MYFYEEGECITNVESGQNAPEDFGTPDDGDKVVYFSNGCVQIESDKNETIVESKKEEPTTEKPVAEGKKNAVWENIINIFLEKPETPSSTTKPKTTDNKGKSEIKRW